MPVKPRKSGSDNPEQGSVLVETSAALIFVSVLMASIAAIQPGNSIHDFTRDAVCLVGAESCSGKSWIELEDTDPPVRRPVTYGAIPDGSVKSEANRQMGKELAAERGWTGSEWDCLDQLWQHESGWDSKADNPTSSAFGIPQAMTDIHQLPPGYEQGDASVQIQWGLDYIGDRYQTPCKAWAHWQSPPNQANWGHWY